jgi:hypothetical protein
MAAVRTVYEVHNDRGIVDVTADATVAEQHSELGRRVFAETTEVPES